MASLYLDVRPKTGLDYRYKGNVKPDMHIGGSFNPFSPFDQADPIAVPDTGSDVRFKLQ